MGAQILVSVYVWFAQNIKRLQTSELVQVIKYKRLHEPSTRKASSGASKKKKKKKMQKLVSWNQIFK